MGKPDHNSGPALAGKLDLSRDSVYHFIHLLREARMLNNLHARGKGISLLQKPEKIYLENTNLAYALREYPETGNLRETFVLNQLTNAGIGVGPPDSGDFFAEGLVIEVGGKNKVSKQVRNEDEYLVAADNIEIGAGGRVPVWLFGFLY